MHPIFAKMSVPALMTVLSAATGATVLHAASESTMPLRPVASQASLSKGLLIPKGALIRLRLEMDLRSGRDKVGEPVLFTVEQNVYSQSHTLLLKQGAIARGHVVESVEHGSLGRSGKLAFSSDYALTDEGMQIPLHLVVTPVPGNGTPEASDGTVGEVAASVSTGAHGYEPYSAYGGNQDGYCQQAGVSGSIAFDPGRLFGHGYDVTANRGQDYDATVAADTALDQTPAVTQTLLLAGQSQQLFTLRDKTQVMGTLAGYDGENYAVNTLAGRRTIRATEVQSIQVVVPQL